MNDLTRNYIKWIKDFDEIQFDKVVETYIKNVWNIEDLVLTDGTNDGGNDIRIFQDNTKLKIQIQVTIQERGIEGKIEKEVKNAVANVESFDYQNTLYFFYSHPISEEKVNELELAAFSKHKIRLQIIDPKKIAAAAKRFPEISDVIRVQYGLDPIKDDNVSENDRMLYDFISFGSRTAEIKNQIIKFFIIHKIYQQDIVDRASIISLCCEHFGNSDSRFFGRIFESLIDSGVLIASSTKNGEFILAKDEVSRIDALKAQFLLQEQKLDADIKMLLEKFGVQTDFSAQVIDQIRILFESNFNVDKQEILDKAYNLEEGETLTSFKKFFNYIKRIASGSSEKAKLLCKRLLETCRENDILQRLSAGKLFSSFTNPDIIRNYVNQAERIVFVDTQIALYALCYYFEQSDYPNPFYQSVKDLLTIKIKQNGISLQFYHNYVNEVAYHLKEALLLIPYEESGLLDGLGGSNNVFFNYYLYLKSEDLLPDNIDSLSEFIYDGFELKESDAFHKRFFNIADGLLQERLKSIGIETYSYALHGQADEFEASKQVIRDCLLEKEKERPDPTINNDANMLSILFDEEVSVNEPIFVSWDQIMFAARKRYYEYYPGSRLWHWFTPNQFITHISLLNFSINSSTITREILSLFDNDFSLYRKSHQLLDTISKIVNVRNETGRKYIKVIKELKRDYIFEVDRELEMGEMITEQVYPIEDLIVSLTKHYTFEDKFYNLEQFKILFTLDNIFDKVRDYFENEMVFYKTHKKNTKDYINRMNELIKEAVLITTDENTEPS
ncbi:hypothetical protein ACQKLP_23815 [Chitinophaga sp. NPDC101104]|uniref:hypothetical protein n=1 Tax=Chitinophaga sp. NPDC101104 TaxID=3390561 RepID=UPI003D0896C7